MQSPLSSLPRPCAAHSPPPGSARPAPPAGPGRHPPPPRRPPSPLQGGVLTHGLDEPFVRTLQHKESNARIWGSTDLFRRDLQNSEAVTLPGRGGAQRACGTESPRGTHRAVGGAPPPPSCSRCLYAGRQHTCRGRKSGDAGANTLVKSRWRLGRVLHIQLQGVRRMSSKGKHPSDEEEDPRP